MNDLVIVGAGGHGRELFATIAAINRTAPRWNVIGFVDDDPRHPERLERLGTGVLGPVAWLDGLDPLLAVAIGSPSTRRALVDGLGRPPETYPTIVHPEVLIGPDVELGPGVIAYERCTVTTDVRIGAHTHLNAGCTVQHDSVVGSFVQFSPGVFVNGDCVVGDDVFLGTGAIITRGCRVGEGATVGAGAVVLDDVTAGSTVVGVPAKLLPR